MHLFSFSSARVAVFPLRRKIKIALFPAEKSVIRRTPCSRALSAAGDPSSLQAGLLACFIGFSPSRFPSGLTKCLCFTVTGSLRTCTGIPCWAIAGTCSDFSSF